MSEYSLIKKEEVMKRNIKETEKKILEVAIDIFSKKGFTGATTNEIAKGAGVAEGTIFKYYPKKKDLLYGAMIKAIDLFTESIVVDTLKEVIEENKEAPIEILLKAIMIDRIKLFENHFPLIKVIFYEMQFHEDLKELFLNKASKNLQEIVPKIFKKRKEKGELKNINDFVAMRSFLGMIILMFLQRSFLPKENAFETIEQEIDVLVEIFVNGIKE
ncbi:TetR family transcriptional regulator [Marinisporobacter balticus]|uniref:TetR family transcriptional regulator n=2 Tax=Marinisporobacter balticus TaxID=2018667 RepID=A0A4R2KBT3_9FIRM|nr:TetR family transcriptional regulator [Marinisporobacter balticus]